MLDQKVAVITGGNSGIGKAIARDFVENGAEVVVSGLNEEKGRKTENEIACIFQKSDIRDYSEVEKLVEFTVDKYGKLDTIINNAGIASESKLGDMKLEEWQDIIDTNLTGVMNGSKAALPHLIESNGSIINTASIYGLVGGAGAAAYSAAKGGVVNFTQQVAVDYAEQGVRVNSICPGFVETPMTEDILEQDRFYNFVKANTPMGRPAQPEEIAPLATFLASNRASYITGVNIPIDGGWTAH